MAIQVWDGSKYVGAELAKFGPAGTLKEALIWDGTKYVKVWPSGPYPLSGTWTGSLASPAILVQHTVTETVTLQIQATVTGNFGPQGFVVAGSSSNYEFGEYGNVVSGTGTSTMTFTHTFQAGDDFYIAAQAQMGGGGAASGSWSITQV